MQIRYKDFAKLEVLAFKGLSVNAEPTVSGGGQSWQRQQLHFFILEKQKQRGTETARGPGVIMHPCCILFIYPL